MLNRERIALKVLEEAGGTLSKTVFVKLMFLIRMEIALSELSEFPRFMTLYRTSMGRIHSRFTVIYTA